MPRHEINDANPVLTGIFAHYCGPWEWNKFARELFARRGYPMLTPDLPIHDPDVTEDEFAAVIRAAQKERGAEEYVDLAHSWGGDKAYRLLGTVPVSMVIFLGAPLREVAKNAGLPQDLNSHSVEYSALASVEQQGEVDFEQERELVGRRLFRGLGDVALQAWATSQLRAHPHKPKPKEALTDAQAVLPNDLPMHYVGFEHDQVYFYKSQQGLFKNLRKKFPDVNIDFSSIPTGHFPMLQAPELFVNHVIEIIEIEKRRQRLQAEADKIDPLAIA